MTKKILDANKLLDRKHFRQNNVTLEDIVEGRAAVDPATLPWGDEEPSEEDLAEIEQAKEEALESISEEALESVSEETAE